jgi:predicted nucleotidyltransferase
MAFLEVGPIRVDGAALRSFCERWNIAELAVFGSILRDDFGPQSDVDVLVSSGGRRWRYEDLLDMKVELRALFGRDVDIARRHVVEGDRNELRRAAILHSARTLCAIDNSGLIRADFERRTLPVGRGSDFAMGCWALPAGRGSG